MRDSCFVRMEGLEPPCLAALDPKSSASTNFATSACLKTECKGTQFAGIVNCLVILFYFCICIYIKIHG